MRRVVKKELADLLRVLMLAIVIGIIMMLLDMIRPAAAYDFIEPFEILRAQGMCRFGKERNVDFQQQITACNDAIKYFSYPESDRAEQIDRFSDLGSAYYDRGEAYHLDGDLEKAEIDFNSAIELGFGHEALDARALVRLDKGEYADAKGDIDASLKMTKVHPETYWLLGQYFEKVGDKAKAIEAYESALQRDPKYALALERLRELENE